jgi:hypothetical protein
LNLTWPAGERLWRCHDAAWGPAAFYPGDTTHRGRFHPFTPAGALGPLPVLYAADDVDGALSESVFHDVPVRGDKHVPHAKLRHRVLSALEVTRDLRLVDLTSPGLSRLGLTRAELIDSDARSYPDTAPWTAALHDHPLGADGLLWVSRQHDTSRCVVLFADRVPAGELQPTTPVTTLPLALGAGLELASVAADRAGITITDIPGTHHRP